MWNLAIFLGPACLSLLATALPADPNDDDYECQSSLWSYDAAESSVRSASSYLTVLSTGTRTTMVTDSDVPLTTLCDGRPRALESYQSTPTTEVFTSVTPRTLWTWPPYTGPSPTCTIAETACTSLLASWSSSWSEYYDNTGTAPVPSPSRASCTTSYKPPTTSWTPAPTSKACSRWPERCMIEPAWGMYQTVYYWPVTTVSGDFCLQNGSTLTPDPTITGAPNTAVRDGHTFTSPTNYLSVKNARAVIWSDYKRIDHCGASGTLTSYTNILVPITATMSTRTAHEYDDGAFAALDFAHFNQPLPAQAYDSFRCMLNGRACGPEEPIYNEGEQMPIMSVPNEILDLAPEWREVGCTYVPRQRWTQWSFKPVPLQTPPPRPL